MEPFRVPQFLEVESKIIGPITTRQFIYIVAGGALIFISYKIFSYVAFILSLILICLFVLIFGFAKINGQNFHFFLINFIETSKKPRLRVWRKKFSAEQLKYYLKLKEPISVAAQTPNQKIIGPSRLSELSLIVDTGGFYSGEANTASQKRADRQ